ncbi:MAG: VanW family protein [Clostridia bacterium]
MARQRYGVNDGYPPRERSCTNRAEQVIVSDEGEFVMPSSYASMAQRAVFADEALYETTAELSPETEDAFVYDDEPMWKQPISAVPMGKRASAPNKRDAVPTHPTGKPTAPKPAKNQEPSFSKRGNGNKQGFMAYVYVGIITISVLCMCVLGVMMMPQMAGYFWTDMDNFAFINGELLRYDRRNVAAYKQYRSYMQNEMIYPGVFVDGVHVGNMTIDEARTTLTAAGSDAPNAYSVTVAIGDKTWTVDSSNVPATRNLGNVLERAYAVGRTNTTTIQSTQQTPFRERTNTALGLLEKGVNLTTAASYDHEAVAKLVDEIAAYVTREPVDAQILSFDYNTRSFSFSAEQPGVTFDKALLYQKITAELDQWKRGVTVTVDPIVTPPKLTKADLAKNFKMVAAFTTDTTKDSNRNNNIELACKAINGTALMPGETFSFNETTGQRTTDKGYREAGAIAAGQSIEEVGGGICQVSSTIFNAVARANLEIVSRSPHAWPSSYVNRGEDATVNWPNLDFKFKNNTNSPVFLITYYKDRKLSAEIWGLSLGDGVSIDLESKVIKTMEPPLDVKYVFDASLDYGVSKTAVKARTGYVVETYQVWYQNGQEQKRELLHKSTYKAYQQVVKYNN